MGRRLIAMLAMVGMAAGLGLVASTSAAAATYSISGTVTLPSGANPAWSDQIYVALEGDDNATVKADATTGAFAFTDLAEGEYSLLAYAYPPGGSGESPNLVAEYFGGAYDWEGRTVITIAGASANDKNIELDFGGIVRGQLYATGGLTNADMQGVLVTATGTTGREYHTRGDSTGKFAITGIAPGQYTFRMDAASYEGPGGGTVTPNVASIMDGSCYDVGTTYSVASTSGSVSLTRNLVAYPAFTASGVVQLADGVNPALLGAAQVALRSEYYCTPQVATVNPTTGAWSLAGLPRVTFEAKASGPGLVPVTYPLINAPTGDVNAGTVTLVAGQPVSGHVTLVDIPFPADVLANTRITLSSPGFTVSNVRVDPATGNWSSEPVPLGSYTVLFAVPYNEAFAREYYNDVYDADLATPVVVTSAGPVTGIDATLAELRHYYSTPSPTISGTKGLGDTLTVKPGAWNPAPTAFTYQWYRNGAAISGATKSSYKLTSSDSTKKLSVKVTSVKTGYTSTAKTSTAATMPKFFTRAPTPAITGTMRKGYTLTAKPGTWSPTPTLYYQWYRNGAAISKATRSTYKLTASDMGKKITVRVTAKRSGYGTHPKFSSARTVYREFSSAPAPTISGTAKAGYKLTAHPRTWSPQPSKFTYQWYRNGAKISGATASTYTLKSVDKGKKITVKVRGSLSGYYSLTRTSAAKAIAR